MKVLRRIKSFFSGERTTDSTKPLFLAFRSSTTFILVTICIAIFNDILIYAIIVPVIPYFLADRVAISEESVQKWNTILAACYTVSLCIGSLAFGSYADHGFSRRWTMLLGLVALSGSTLLLCLGRIIALLILGRILQGLSGAIVWSVGLALTADTMGYQVGMAMGYITIAMTLGSFISPIIGGAVYSKAGYYPVYYIVFGAIYVDIVFRLLLIEKKIAKQWLDGGQESRLEETNVKDSEIDLYAWYSVAEEGPTPTGRQNRANDLSMLENGIIGQVAASTPCVATRSNAVKYPKLHLLKSRRLLAANFGIVTQAGGIFMVDTVMPLFVKETFNWDSLAAGLIFFCICVPGLVAPAVGWLSDRYGAKWPSAFGFMASMPPLVCMRLIQENTAHDKVLFGVLLSMLGFTYTFANTPLMAETSYVIKAEEINNPGIFGLKGVYGLGYGLFTFSFALGGSIGSLASGYLVTFYGWNIMTLIFAIWLGFGGIVVAIWVK